MKKYLLNIFIIMQIIFFSCLKQENSNLHIDEIIIEYSDFFVKLCLPFNKPKNITTVFSSAFDGLIIDEIIVDNKKIESNEDITAHFESRNSRIESLEKNNIIEMLWEVRQDWGSMYDENLSNGIFFTYFNNQDSDYLRSVTKAQLYNIPYGSKKIKIKYKVYYPNRVIGDEIYIKVFNLIWPDIRLADDYGNIKTPVEYINLGLIKPDNYISIDLPFTRHLDNLYINERSLLIYELIGDGKVINHDELNENISILAKNETLKKGIDSIKMIWHKHNNEDNYLILHGTKEIYMTYSIIFFMNVEGLSSIIFNDRICVKWEIDW
ncbi:MAG: hypothetical protein FWD47_00125 [Treponema sp.]|nr:hypothetical protein [Treponema sp.]